MYLAALRRLNSATLWSDSAEHTLLNTCTTCVLPLRVYGGAGVRSGDSTITSSESAQHGLKGRRQELWTLSRLPSIARGSVPGAPSTTTVERANTFSKNGSSCRSAQSSRLMSAALPAVPQRQLSLRRLPQTRPASLRLRTQLSSGACTVSRYLANMSLSRTRVPVPRGFAG